MYLCLVLIHVAGKVGKRCKKYAKQIKGEKYCYNDDAADSACIALYGFCKGRSLKKEE